MRRIVIVWIVLVLSGCKEEAVYLPKPRMYPKVEYPAKTYEWEDIEYCAFRFRAPSYMDVKQDQYFFEDQILHPCWFDLVVPELRASLHCSYYPLNSREELDRLVYDAFQVTNEHNKKANYIEDGLISIADHNVHGMIFNVEGPVASPVQFFLTDSTSHFFRAALYFKSKVDADSTAPIVQYLQQDIDSLIGSWEWKS